MEDKHIEVIVGLSITGLLLFATLIILVGVINDLKKTNDMYKNSRDVCRIQLEELTSEYRMLDDSVRNDG